MQLILAPLHGVTNRVFRKAYFNHFRGFDEAFAPFVLSVRADRLKEKHFKDLVPEDGGVHLVPQILGGDAADFLATAKVIASLGYGEVNWNLGCPYPMVAKKGRGSGLLPHPDRIARFLDEVRPSLGIALSLKMRLGRHDREEIGRLMPVLNGYPIARVVIHPRLGVQMYTGTVDLDGFEAAAAACAHPVVYNGDIGGKADFEAIRRRFPGVGAWMIGRGALADPFLAADIRGLPPGGDRLAAVRAFHDELYASYRSVLYGSAHVLDKMKEAWGYLGPSFPAARRRLAALGRARTFDEYERETRAIFDGGVWKYAEKTNPGRSGVDAMEH